MQYGQKRQYKEHYSNFRKIHCCMDAVHCLMFVVENFRSDDKCSLDAYFDNALKSRKFQSEEIVCMKTLFNFSISNSTLPLFCRGLLRF